MKRSHSDMIATLSALPPASSEDPQLFKGTLQGTHRLKVTKAVDISKPVDKPIEEIDEPEEEDIARENIMSKNNARMIQLDLVDLNNQEIRALETEHIDKLTNVKPGSILSIVGPVTIRCGNLMLEKKHVINLDFIPNEEIQVLKETKKEELCLAKPPDLLQSALTPAPAPAPLTQQAKLEPPPTPIVVELTKEEEVIMLEDWDEDDENDCICLD